MSEVAESPCAAPDPAVPELAIRLLVPSYRVSYVITSYSIHYTKLYDGETVHFEYRTNTRFAGTATINVALSDNTNIVAGAPMLEVQQGAQWIYTYDWDTTSEAADTYQVQLWDGGDADPTATVSVILDNPATQINLYADAGYTTPTDIFADGATVFV